MPRRPRILLADYPMHIVQRGINREPYFFADEDCQCYLHWLKEAARDCRCAIHAYVLMTNHVHLLLTPATPGAPARLMQSLGRRCVQYANRQYRRTGSLWEGRYKSSVVRAEAYQAVIAFDPEISMFRGEFLGLSGGADFYAADVDGLRREGETSLRVFLEACRRRGIDPRKHYSGKFVLRLDPDAHEAAVIAAAANGKSLNQSAVETLRDAARAR